jgi:uncharacterized protein (TIGR00290 family)
MPQFSRIVSIASSLNAPTEMPKEAIIVGWSGGKDSAMALAAILREGRYEVAGFLTTCSEGLRRVHVHGVRCSLLRQQAIELGIPLRKVFVPQRCSNPDYENRMRTVLAEFQERGIKHVAFGDLFLDEIRAYRNSMLAPLGMTAVYPLWGRDTATLARQFIDAGFRAVLVCVNTQHLDASFVGRMFDADLLDELPGNVDPCGENGEFHTFVFDGPIFSHPIRFRSGRVSSRGHFHFADLLPLPSLKPQTKPIIKP